MRIRIDADICIGCGACVDICPDMLEMENDLAIVKSDLVPDDLESCCREAADSCPVEAVILEE